MNTLLLLGVVGAAGGGASGEPFVLVSDFSANAVIGPTPGALSITDFSTNIVRRMTYGILIATDFSANAVIGPTPGALSITDFSANIVAT